MANVNTFEIQQSISTQSLIL